MRHNYLLAFIGFFYFSNLSLSLSQTHNFSVYGLKIDSTNKNDIENRTWSRSNTKANKPVFDKENTLIAEENNTEQQLSPTGGAPFTEQSLVVFPSPNAASIVNQIQETVDFYTGKLNVNIPLYTFKSRELEVPISLSYNTSGQKVNELASWVGLGWTLNAGGVISRVMKGLPDEFKGTVNPSPMYSFSAYGYLHRGKYANHDDFFSTSDLNRKKTIGFGNVTGDLYNLGLNIEPVEAWDLEPDEFYFNFPGYSGKFVFDENGDIHTIPHQQLVINKTIVDINGVPKLTSFEVITPEGNKYLFGSKNMQWAVEESLIENHISTARFYHPKVGSLQGDPVWHRYPLLNVVIKNGQYQYDLNVQKNTYNFFNSSWYLDKIISPNGDIINFEYQDTDNLIYIQNKSQEVRHPNITEIEYLDSTYYITPSIDNEPQYQDFTNVVNFIVLKGKRLAKISNEKGDKIIFEANTARKDFVVDKALDKISIYNYKDELIKSFILKHKFIGRPAIELHDFILTWQGNTPVMIEENPANDIVLWDLIAGDHARMYLTDLIEIGADKKQLPYQFKYYADGILPRRNSYQQDTWGYYNKNLAGTTIPWISYTASDGKNIPYYKPKLPIFAWTNVHSAKASFFGADLTPCLDSAKVGSLQKIIYPTGGAREFFYELNTTGLNTYGGGLRVFQEKIYPNSIDTSNYLIEQYQYKGVTMNYPFYKYQLASKSIGEYKKDDVLISSHPVNALLFTKGSNIGYYEVTHFKKGFGKTIYKFFSSKEIENVSGKVYEAIAPSKNKYSVNTYPFPPDTDFDWQRGLIKEITNYNNEEKLVKKLTYNYNFNPKNLPPIYIYGLKSGIHHVNDLKEFKAGLYSYISHNYELKSITEELFNQNNAEKITNITEYEYNIYHRQLAKQTQYTLGDPKIYMTEYQYPMDYLYNEPEFDQNAWALYTMVNKHMHSQLVEQTKYFLPEADKPLVMLSSRLNLYRAITDKDGDKVFPYQVLTLQKPGGIEDFKPSEIEFFPNNDPDKFKLIYNARYQLQTTFDRFDSYGNLLQKTDKNGLAIYYKWSYQRSLPVASSLDRIILFCDFEGSDDNVSINETFVSEGREGSSGINLLYKESSVSKNLSGVYIPKGDYTFSLWVKGEEASNLVLTYTIPNQAPIIVKMPFEATGEDWQYISTKIPFSNSATGISLVVKSEKPVVIDDILLHPEGSKVETYTYRPLIGMSSKTDANKQVSRFSYDDFNRLKLIKDHQNNLLQHYQYHYKMSD